MEGVADEECRYNVNGCCDDCISEKANIKPRQQVNQICRQINQIMRYRSRCAICGWEKTVNVLQTDMPQSGVSTPSITPDPTIRGPRRKLVCDTLDLNDIEMVRRILQASIEVLSNPRAWYRFEVWLPTDPGRYIICNDKKMPLYVGKAENLNYQLNTTNGSLDQFANSRKSQDPTRNFIKALCTTGFIPAPYVAVIRKQDILSKVEIGGPLTELYRGNIEKLLDLFKCLVVGSGI